MIDRIDDAGGRPVGAGNFHDTRLARLSAGIALTILAALMVRYQFLLLSFMEAGDEAETIVASKMIAAGMSLYADIFNHHGPLTFLPGVLLEKFGSFGVPGHRVTVAILQWVALAAICYSPMIRDRVAGAVYAGVAGTVMLVYMSSMYAHMYLYQVLGGLMLVIALAQYTLPAIARNEHLGRKAAALGNVLLASLPFLAITYLPVAILLFAASLRGRIARWSIAWFAVGIALNVAFLVLIGSIAGFAAYHLHLNATVLALYTGVSSPLQLMAATFGNATRDHYSILIAIMFAAAVTSLSAREGSRFPWRSLLLPVAIGSLLFRGIEFHGIPYFYACLALPLSFAADTRKASAPALIAMTVFLVICMVKLSLIVPVDRERLQGHQLARSSEFSTLARALTKPDERIISYTFANSEYILADRLPASGHFFYFPWQEKYNEAPRFGIKMDACAEIRKNRPKVMRIDKWTVWDRYPWDTYAGCIQNVIDESYEQVVGRPYYVRKDVLAKSDIGIATARDSYRPVVGTPLDQGAPRELPMAKGHLARSQALKRVGILFATYRRVNAGEAELRLKGPDGATAARRFRLDELRDNEYRFFDLDSKRYTSAELATLSGGGASVWQSVDAAGVTAACMIFDYADGSRRFTEGCPT